jgi:serine/threonine protein kinase
MPCIWSVYGNDRGVEIFKLLLALAKQIESFIHGCYKDTWIQSAMTLTNISEYVSSIGFNLELCRIAFCKNCAAIGLTLDEVDGISKGEVEIVEKKASIDVDALFDKVLLIMPSLSHENKDLAIYLLRRLKRVKPIPASIMSIFSLISTNDGGFFGKLFKRIQQPVRLGTCGSGATVDKAMWLETVVAVKTFYGPDDPDFMKEVEILKGLCHPNITSMFCSAMDRRRCSIIMELMDEDLHALMQRRLDANSDSPPFSILEAYDIMLQIGEGVNYLHNKKIVHRDLKSMNILVKSMDKGESKFGYVHAKVNDFGLSKIKATNTRFSTLTTNTGTNKWMAPEIILLNGGSQERHAKNAKMPKYPHKVDVYSFAMVCYEILTGQVPFFQIMTPSIVKTKVLNGNRPELPLYCPPKVKTLIEECWNQEPIKRPSFDNICKRLKYLKCLLMTSKSLQLQLCKFCIY